MLIQSSRYVSNKKKKINSMKLETILKGKLEMVSQSAILFSVYREQSMMRVEIPQLQGCHESMTKLGFLRNLYTLGESLFDLHWSRL